MIREKRMWPLPLGLSPKEYLESVNENLGDPIFPRPSISIPEENDENWKHYDQADYAILADYYEEELKRNA